MTVISASEDEARIDMHELAGALWSKSLRIVLVTLAFLGLTYAILQFVPRLYESSTSLLVEPRNTTFTRAATDNGTRISVAGEVIIDSEIELIQSRDTLLKVVASEGLTEIAEFGAPSPSPIGMVLQLFGRSTTTAPSQSTAVNMLRERLVVAQERSSGIVTINVRAQDSELAARLANAIGRAHVRRRADLTVEDTAEASQWLEVEIQKLRNSVTAAEVAVADFKVKKDLFVGANNTSLLDQQLSDIATQITAAQERKNTAQSRANLIRGLLDAGQPIGGVQSIRDSVVIQEMSQEKGRLQGEKALLSATLLANHPQVQALAAQIAEIDKQILVEGRRIARGLAAEAEIEAALAASLKDDLTRLKISASDATRDGVTLGELEREATAQRALLENYLLRFRDASLRSETSSSLPDIRVVTLAVPSSAPASPKTALTLMAVGIVSLALQVGAVILGELAAGRALSDARVSGLRSEDDEFAEPPHLPVQPDAVPETEQAVWLEPQVDDPDPELSGEARNEQSGLSGPEAAGLEPPEARTGIEPDPAHNRSLEEDELAALAIDESLDPQPGPWDGMACLAGDAMAGRERVFLIAALDERSGDAALGQALADELLENKLSVVRVDARKGPPGVELGLSDLCAGQAEFGDVVHRGHRDGFAQVPWGQGETLDRRSPKPATLLEALADLYEVVIVLTGHAGMTSALPVFAGLDGCVVFVSATGTGTSTLEAARADARALGFQRTQSVVFSASRADVA